MFDQMGFCLVHRLYQTAFSLARFVVLAHQSHSTLDFLTRTPVFPTRCFQPRPQLVEYKTATRNRPLKLNRD